MKFCIAFMMQNEESWLRLHLPVFLKSSAIDGIVAIDGGSTDNGPEYVRSLGGVVMDRPWDWKPKDQENAVIQLAEWMGYDCILLTAPDELWFPEHIDEMKALMEDATNFALRFPTYNFVRDRRHYAPDKPFFPDMHERVWRLGQGIRHVGELDSTPSFSPDQALTCLHLPMFHYSWTKPRRWHFLKQINFHRVRDGLLPISELPADIVVEDYPYHVPFLGPQPLEPDDVGEHAPYNTGR